MDKGTEHEEYSISKVKTSWFIDQTTASSRVWDAYILWRMWEICRDKNKIQEWSLGLSSLFYIVIHLCLDDILIFNRLLGTVVLCWIPFVVKYFKGNPLSFFFLLPIFLLDVVHYCPGCGKKIGRHYKLWSSWPFLLSPSLSLSLSLLFESPIQSWCNNNNKPDQWNLGFFFFFFLLKIKDGCCQEYLLCWCWLCW